MNRQDLADLQRIATIEEVRDLLLKHRSELLQEISTMLDQREKPNLSVAEFAEVTGLSKSTIINRIRSGVIEAIQPFGPSGKYLIPREEINKMGGGK